MIRTTHIGDALEHALGLAEMVNGQPDDERLLSPSGPEQQAMLPPAPHGATTWMALERAANLARHAADELEDELQRARGHWPVV